VVILLGRGNGTSVFWGVNEALKVPISSVFFFATHSSCKKTSIAVLALYNRKYY
jgi:hypothetical protein